MRVSTSFEFGSDDGGVARALASQGGGEGVLLSVS